jgi:hypothetical protein
MDGMASFGFERVVVVDEKRKNRGTGDAGVVKWTCRGAAAWRKEHPKAIKRRLPT